MDGGGTCKDIVTLKLAQEVICLYRFRTKRVISFYHEVYLYLYFSTGLYDLLGLTQAQ